MCNINIISNNNNINEMCNNINNNINVKWK